MVEGYTILPLDCPIVTVKDEANFSIPFCSPFVIGLVLEGANCSLFLVNSDYISIIFYYLNHVDPYKSLTFVSLGPNLFTVKTKPLQTQISNGRRIYSSFGLSNSNSKG
jgi:hypothetical protein